MKKYFLKLLYTAFLISTTHSTLAWSGRHFDQSIIVIFENTNYADVIKEPFFAKLANQGANFDNFLAETHPSQPNYIALTSASLHGISTNNIINLSVRNMVDLLEEKGLTWKAYAEDYPGQCFLGATSKDYVRKHNPFISYLNISKNPNRCANIVNADQFDLDAQSGKLPNYSFYIPNNKNNAHDTNIAFADKWYSTHFSKYVDDPKFMQNKILISTFDESGISQRNKIYTTIVGPSVKNETFSDNLNHYSLIKMFEDNWDLGNLGKEDVRAKPIPNIWRW